MEIPDITLLDFIKSKWDYLKVNVNESPQSPLNEEIIPLLLLCAAIIKFLNTLSLRIWLFKFLQGIGYTMKVVRISMFWTGDRKLLYR